MVGNSVGEINKWKTVSARYRKKKVEVNKRQIILLTTLI